MKRTLFLPLVLLATACGVRSPIESTLEIVFVEEGRMRTTARTAIGSYDRNDRAMDARVAETRQQLLAGTDEWSGRFNRVRAQSERIVYEKEAGALSKAERSALFPRDDLQRFFGDLSVTVNIQHGEGWTEFSLYPGSSTRATRAQRALVEETLRILSQDVAGYLAAMHRLYQYLEGAPSREVVVFKLLLEDKEKSLIEEEQALIDDVQRTGTSVSDHLASVRPGQLTIDELFDLVFNPLPAEIGVRVPGAILAVENFEKTAESVVTIRRHGILDAARALENVWLSPDPLAMGELRNVELSVEELAALPRKSTPLVTAAEIEKAFLEKLRPHASYKVRWAEPGSDAPAAKR